MNSSLKQRELIAAIDEAIRNEAGAQREYLAKAEMFQLPIFRRLAQMEQEHERQLRDLRAQVLQRIEARAHAEEG